MNKKLLISLSIIGVVAAVAIGATIAYYNDVETSTGNIFTAGSMDLKVDHVRQTYNDVDCETCSVSIYSSIATQVVAANAVASYQGPFPIPAVEVASPHPAWANEGSIPPSQWIWIANAVSPLDTQNNAEYTFENKFNWNGTVAGVNFDLGLAADNGYKIILNGTTIVDKLGDEFNYGSVVPLTPGEETAFENAIVLGQNTLRIVVRNKAGNPNSASNPAGLLFALNIQRAGCEADSAFQQACRLWTEKDLGQGDTFFNFEDVKPGDRGTNIISVHVFGNNAYSCLLVTNPQDNENTWIDTEKKAGDTTQGPTGNGELSQFLSAVLWSDVNSNKQYDAHEPILYGPAALKDIKTMTRLPLTATSTSFIGLAWCLGTQTVNQDTGVISCSGVGNQDKAQTDSFLASLTAYAEQQRNNENFSCANVIILP